MNKALLLCLVVALLGLTNAANTCADHPMYKKLENFAKLAGDFKEKPTDNDAFMKAMKDFIANVAPGADATMT
jgi:hypothetical protein